jgi:hypothetical protein
VHVTLQLETQPPQLVVSAAGLCVFSDDSAARDEGLVQQSGLLQGTLERMFGSKIDELNPSLKLLLEVRSVAEIDFSFALIHNITLTLAMFCPRPLSPRTHKLSFFSLNLLTFYRCAASPGIEFSYARIHNNQQDLLMQYVALYSHLLYRCAASPASSSPMRS